MNITEPSVVVLKSAADMGSERPSTERINGALRDHQESVADWSFAGKLEELRWSVEVMVLKFKLQIPQPCLAVDRLRRAYGHFRHGRNGFGLRDDCH